MFRYVIGMLIACAVFVCCSQPSPYSKEELRKRVELYANNHDYTKVIEACDSIIELDNEDYWPFEQKGIAFYLTDQYDSALSALQVAIAINDTSFESYYWRANTRERLGDTLGAISDHSKVLEINPRYANALNNRGELYKNQKKYNLAIRDFKDALKQDSGLLATYNNIGTAYSLLGMSDSAMYYYDVGISKEGTDYLFFQRGLEKMRQQRYADALLDFNEAERINKINPYIYLYRGNCYSYLDRKDLMCEDYSRAAQLGSEEAKEVLLQACAKST